MLDFRGLVESALQALDRDRAPDAEKSIRAALGMNPRDDQLLHLLGVALVRQGREEEAIEPLQRAISLNRRDAEYHNALGCALRNVGRHAEGVESLQRALKLDPGLQDARYNLGQTWQRMGEYDKAEAEFRRIQLSNPGDVEVIGALSGLAWFRSDHEGALAILRQGIAKHPGSGDMRFLLGDQLLALGRFEEGWFHYLWRVNRHAVLRRFGLPFDAPDLMARFPSSLEGVTVRVHGEQGLGDDLFFLRFARLLRERGARVVGAVSPRVLGMVERSGILDACEPAADRMPPAPDWRLVGDLPYLLGAHSQPVPGAVRFAPLPERAAEIATRLDGLARPLIGLTWRAGTGPETGARDALYKALPAGEFFAMAQQLPGTLLVLQREPKPGEIDRLHAACPGRVADFSALNADLEGMCALLATIDDYVGVSNTNMHLRAALGRTARVLVSRSVEFRWMAAGDSPWFPGFPVYRQGENGAWGASLTALIRDCASKYVKSI